MQMTSPAVSAAHTKPLLHFLSLWAEFEVSPSEQTWKKSVWECVQGERSGAAETIQSFVVLSGIWKWSSRCIREGEEEHEGGTNLVLWGEGERKKQV
jgi:hypothetical protein